MKLKISILTAVLAMAAVSCLKNEIIYDTDDIDYRSLAFAAPIAKIHAPLYETMLKELDFDDLFVKDGVVCVRYTQSENIDWGEDIGLSGISIKRQIPFGGSATGEDEFPIRLTSSEKTDSYVDRAYLTNGEIGITLAGAGALSGNIQMFIPGLTKDGVAFSQTIPLPSSGTPYEYPLGDYILQTDDNRELTVKFVVNASGTGLLDVFFTLSDMDVRYLTGYFGEMEKTESATMDFDFFDELDFSGTVGFKDIQMDAVVTNWADLPVKIKADIFFTYDNIPEQPLGWDKDIEFSVKGAAISNNYQTVAPKIEPFSAKIRNEILFENGNYPSGLRFEVEGISNPPNGNSNNGVQNILVKRDDDPLATVDFTLTVPLHVKISEYSRKDTIDFDYNDLVGNDEDYVNEVKYVNIRLLVENALPFDVTLTATAIDGAEEKVEEIAKMDIKAIKEKKTIEVKLTKDQLKNFRDSHVMKIVLHTKANSRNNDYVQVKETDFLNMDVSVSLKANIPSNL